MPRVCAANSSGYFEVGFLRLKRKCALRSNSREQFVWMSPSVKVGVDFWANEAAERFWINKVQPAPAPVMQSTYGSTGL